MEKKQWTDFFADAFVLRLQYYGEAGGGVLNSVSVRKYFKKTFGFKFCKTVE